MIGKNVLQGIVQGVSEGFTRFILDKFKTLKQGMENQDKDSEVVDPKDQKVSLALDNLLKKENEESERIKQRLENARVEHQVRKAQRKKEKNQ